MPFTTEAIVSPWGGDPTAILKHFMPARDILRMIVAPGFAKSPAQGRG